MKILVAVPSRGRPAALIGVVMALERLKSERHEVAFAIGHDYDDQPTLDALGLLRNEATIIRAPMESMPMGAVWNQLAGYAREHDAVTFMTDRTFCITPGWDDILAQAIERVPTRVLWWSCPQDPDCVIPIMSRKLLEAAGYRYADPIYPFWFIDTHWREIDTMIHGKPLVKLQATYAGARAKTQNARDIAFWFKVFAVKRADRAAQAIDIARRLGVTFSGAMLERIKTWDAEMQEAAPRFERIFGDTRMPSAIYLDAKRQAEEFLNGRS